MFSDRLLVQKAKLIEKIVFDNKVSNRALRLAIAILSHLNCKDGRCFPKMKTLIQKSGIHQKHIYDHLQELQEHGYMNRDDKGNFHFHFDEIKPKGKGEQTIDVHDDGIDDDAVRAWKQEHSIH